MDGSFELDLDELRSSLGSVDQILVRFAPIPERLFIDFRTNDTSGPGVYLLAQVSSFAERLSTIEKVRPGFPTPEQLQVVSWPLRVGALDRLGLLQVTRDRLAAMDAYDAIKELDGTYARLIVLEEQEVRRAITGEGYHSLWPSTPQRR